MAFLVGMPFYALGGPATHWTHGSFNKGLISLGANFALPIVGGFIGQSVHCVPSDHADDCGTRGFFTGFGVALVTVPLIDAIALGWEDIPDDDPLPSVGSPPAPGAGTPAVLPRPRAASFTILPAWSIGPKGELGFGMAGRF
jgi:hypothetical protein